VQWWRMEQSTLDEMLARQRVTITNEVLTESGPHVLYITSDSVYNLPEMGIGETTVMRALRIAGIIAFAVIIGYAANSLYNMYESGSLFDSYNSQRADKVALLAISVLSMGVLACMEVLGSRNEPEYSAFGQKHYREDRGEVITGKEVTSIYTAPKNVDPWQGRREIGARSDNPSKEVYDHWLHVIRVLCAILPFAYIVVCASIWMSGNPHGQEYWVLPTLFSCMALLSLFVAVGVFRLKKWGLSLGYLLAIINLVIFPYGTIVGLLLLIGLAGASPAFTIYSSKVRRKAARPVSI